MYISIKRIWTSSRIRTSADQQGVGWHYRQTDRCRRCFKWQVFTTARHNFQLTGSVQEKLACLSDTEENVALCISISLETTAYCDNKNKDKGIVKANKTNYTWDNSFHRSYKFSGFQMIDLIARGKIYLLC